jgi:hypothetical protein
MPQWAIESAYRVASGKGTDIDLLAGQPELIFIRGGMTPDPWQMDCLKSRVNLMLNCSRQVGKSLITAAIAMQNLLLMSPSLVLIVSPSERQSGELMKDKIKPLYEPWRALCPLVKDNESEKTFANGSRLVALPGKTDANIRSYSSVALLIMDEASRIPDLIYDAVTPMLVVSGGRKIAMSTPFGKRGWFYKQWSAGIDWKKVQIIAEQCPRLVNARTSSGKLFLEVEKQEKGQRAYNQEYNCHLPSTGVLRADGCAVAVGGLSVGQQVLYRTDSGQLRKCAVVAVRDTGIQDIVSVDTEIGTQLMATRDHPVASRFGRVDLNDAESLMYSFNRTYAQDPDAVMARLVGHSLGDGHVNKRAGRKAHLATSFFASWYGKKRSDMAVLAADVCRSGLLANVGEKLKKGNARTIDMWVVTVGKEAALRLVARGAAVGRKVEQDFDVPDWIMGGSDLVKCEFLAALFGAEGYTPFHRTNKKMCAHPSLTMHKSEESYGHRFFSGLVLLLRDVCIDSHYRIRDDKNGRFCCTLVIGGGMENTKAFFDRVGYRYSFEKELLAFRWSAYIGAMMYDAVARRLRILELRRSGMTWEAISPLVGMRGVGSWNLLYATKVRSMQPRRDFPKFAQWVEERWCPNGIYAKVVSKKVCVSQPTVNIQVDSPDHSYLLGDGLVKYNCSFEENVGAVFLESDIMAAFGDTIDGYGPLDLFGYGAGESVFVPSHEKIVL